MKTLLKNARIRKGLKIREVAQQLGVDQALVSKFEGGTRYPTEDQARRLAQILSIAEEPLMIIWLKEKLLRELRAYTFADEAILMVQEELAEYKRLSDYHYSDRLEAVLNEIDQL